jgi:hypothetical protein
MLLTNLIFILITVSLGPLASIEGVMNIGVRLHAKEEVKIFNQQ